MAKGPPKKPPTGPPRRRHLTHEDEALWAHAAASLKPLRRKKPRHVAASEDLDAVPPFEAKTVSASKPASRPVAAAPAKSVAPKPPPSTPSLNTFDRKAARKLRQGRFEIEARIDLHGMRQHEAHAALRRFLLGASGRGVRWVLVITGKGGPRRREDDDGFVASERGVLRKNVPMWLAEPELRAIVVSYTTAAVSHGGEGALYIQLRNPERVRS